MRTDQVFRRCLADCDLMAGACQMLAADYDWMFDDDELANGRTANLPAAARLLQRISRTSVVLDAACGTGVDAAVLARRAVGAGGGQLAVEADRLICQSTGSGLCRCPTAAMELDSHLVVPGHAGMRRHCGVRQVSQEAWQRAWQHLVLPGGPAPADPALSGGTAHAEVI
jgi:hypothetical protein